MLKIEEINSYNDFEKLNKQWDALLHESNIDSFFLTHEWILSWWKNLGIDKKLFILVVRENEKILAIAPFMFSKGTLTKMPVRKIEFIGAGWGYGGFILLDKHEQCLNLIWNYLKEKSKSWDVAVLSNISINNDISSIEKTIADSNLLYIYEKNFIPYIPLRDNWNNYISQRSYSFRRNLKNRERRINKIGKVKFERFNSNLKDINSLMNVLFDISKRSWKAKERTAIASDEKVKNFYLDLAKKLYEKNWLDISILKVNEKPISYKFGAIFKRKYIDIDIAFDDDYSSFSPGNLHRCYLLKQLFEEDLDEVDSVMAFDYKKELTNFKREFARILIFKKSLYSMFHFIMRLKILPLLKRKAF